MHNYQPMEGKLLAVYQAASGATAYIMDTSMRNVSEEELRLCEEKAEMEARRILECRRGVDTIEMKR